MPELIAVADKSDKKTGAVRPKSVEDVPGHAGSILAGGDLLASLGAGAASNWSADEIDRLVKQASISSSILPNTIGALSAIAGIDAPGGLLGSFRPARTFLDEFTSLRQRIDEQARALREQKTTVVQREQKIEELERMLVDYDARKNLAFLLERVRPEAQRALLESEELRARFLQPSECDVFVMSIDIRRSTDLMLKARSAERFAEFITRLCHQLMDIIKDNYGVVDKFTGDGVLAFFPSFFSGADAGYYVLRAAAECHRAFANHYKESRGYFTSVLIDTGLGVGVDFGSASLVKVADGLTVVGAPVVYACRLSGAPPGTTLLNQPAYEKLNEQFGHLCFVEESELQIKHEGAILAYSVKPNGARYQPAAPPWAASPNAAATETPPTPGAET